MVEPRNLIIESEKNKPFELRPGDTYTLTIDAETVISENVQTNISITTTLKFLWDGVKLIRLPYIEVSDAKI
jgi:hypothetical protein